MKKLLLKLIARAYKEGYNDACSKCEADHTFFEKLLNEFLD